jgi:hypothetical protein
MKNLRKRKLSVLCVSVILVLCTLFSMSLSAYAVDSNACVFEDCKTYFMYCGYGYNFPAGYAHLNIYNNATLMAPVRGVAQATFGCVLKYNGFNPTCTSYSVYPNYINGSLNNVMIRADYADGRWEGMKYFNNSTRYDRKSTYSNSWYTYYDSAKSYLYTDGVFYVPVRLCMSSKVYSGSISGSNPPKVFIQ